jgi:hypothetical protein
MPRSALSMTYRTEVHMPGKVRRIVTGHNA